MGANPVGAREKNRPPKTPQALPRSPKKIKKRKEPERGKSLPLFLGNCMNGREKIGGKPIGGGSANLGKWREKKNNKKKIMKSGEGGLLDVGEHGG